MNTARARRVAGPGPMEAVSSRADVAIMVLRVVAGGMLLVHGVQNLSDPTGHIAGTAAFGIPFPFVAGWLSMFGEAGLGLMMLVGVLTRLAAGLAVVLMTTTWVASTAAIGLVTAEPGITSENALLIAAAAATVMVLGGGRFTLAQALNAPAIFH